MASRILNYGEWRAHLLDRLRRQVAVTADERLAALYDEVSAYPGETAEVPGPGGEIAVPLRFDAGGRELAFFSTDRHLRHRGRHHARRAGDRGVLPRRRGDFRLPAG